MKRLSKVLSVVFIAVYLVLAGCIGLSIISSITNSARSSSGSDQLVYLHLENVPEGTVFADVLAKGHWERESPTYMTYEPVLGISGHDCEIAQYDKDGYKSLMFHTEFFYTGDRIDPAQPDNKICFEDWAGRFEYLPYIKVAYCDKDGNILGITEEKHIMPVFLRRVSYDLYADGDELSYKAGTVSPFRDSRMWLLFIAMTIFGVVYLIRNKRRKKKLLQSGETDNERKE
ncbi:MAG: hypothetical protein WBK46_16160 [Ruminococcus flavefaciens]